MNPLSGFCYPLIKHSDLKKKKKTLKSFLMELRGLLGNSLLTHYTYNCVHMCIFVCLCRVVEAKLISIHHQ